MGDVDVYMGDVNVYMGDVDVCMWKCQCMSVGVVSIYVCLSCVSECLHQCGPYGSAECLRDLTYIK